MPVHKGLLSHMTLATPPLLIRVSPLLHISDSDDLVLRGIIIYAEKNLIPGQYASFHLFSLNFPGNGILYIAEPALVIDV